VKVGVVAPPWERTPPLAYGGAEAVTALMVEGLVELGHEVTLVAAPGSFVEGARVCTPLAHIPDEHYSWAEWRHVVPALEELSDVEALVDHSGPLAALLAGSGRRPIAHVVHGPLHASGRAVYRAVAERSPGVRLIALSEAQRRLAPELPFMATCHNGVDHEAIAFRRSADGYLVFLGRMAPEKGAVTAIDVARRAGLPLMIAARCRRPDEQAYFRRFVEPELGPDVVWLGELTSEDKYELLGGAAALIFPIAWDEPFGLVMIEAMACGTPVLATPCASVPEVVQEGVTGFIRADADGLAEAAGRLGELDRVACRRRVAERFSKSAMATAYDRVVRALASKGARRARRNGAPG
jgi:glycosyltransferase involved in cell wall biosynthesis